MKISVDGGGMSALQRYGTYTFSENLIRAVRLYDKRNKYYIHRLPKLSLGWMKVQVSAQEILKRNDVFLALNQALPLYTPAKIISFSHGLSFAKYPEYYPKDSRRSTNQLKELLRRSALVVVSSKHVKKELLAINKKVNVRVLPFGIPFDFDEPLVTRREKYFLCVGMDHPIKNFSFIKKCFKKFSSIRQFSTYRLVFMSHENDRRKLKKLYAGAIGYLTASYYESFNFPVLEALSQNTPVIGLRSSIIPEFNEFVNVVNTEEEFVEKMTKIATRKRIPVDLKKLKRRFSWESYVENLMKLYTA